MSRTYRKYDPDYGYYRKPKARNEIRQLELEEEYLDLPESKHNHKSKRRSRIAADWDGMPVSARHEDWETRHSS